MSDHNSIPKNIIRVSRRTFLMASAAVGGAAAAFLGGLRRFPFQQTALAESDPVMGPFSAAGPDAEPPLGWPCKPPVGTYYYVGPNEQFTKIQDAVNHVDLRPGDTIFVHGGTYNERVAFFYYRISGEAGAPITVAAYPGEEPIIDGKDEIPTAGGTFPVQPGDSPFYYNQGLVDIATNHIVFEGFTIKNSMGRGMRVFRHKEQDEFVQTKNVTIRNCKIFLSRGSGVLIEGCNGVTIENCDIGCNCSFAPYHRSPITDLNWPPGLGVTGFQPDEANNEIAIKSQNIAVRRTKIHENWGEGFLADNQDKGTEIVSITECEFWDNMAPSIYLHGVKDVLVEGNFLFCSTERADDSCLSPQNEGPAAKDGIAIAPTEPGLTEEGFEPVDSEDITVINNIIVGFGHNNLAFFNQEDQESEQPKTEEKRFIRRVKILFNTLVDGQVHGVLISPSNYENCELKNNLIYQSKGESIAGNSEGWTISNNYKDGYPRLVGPPSDVRKPGVVQAAWYKIKHGSPARRAAMASNLVEVDYFGNWRNKIKPDIGAHEFRYELKNWSPWRRMQFNADWPWNMMVVGANDRGRLEVCAVAGDGSTWHAWQREGGGWNKEWWPFFPQEKQFRNLAVGANEDGRLEVFGVARDSSPWHNWQQTGGEWSGWEPFHVASDQRWQKMVVGANEDGRLEVFALAGDGSPWVTWQQRDPNLPAWHDWVQVSAWVDLTETGKFEELAVSRNRDGRLEVFGLTENDKIWHAWQYLPNNPPWCGWSELNPESDRQWQKIAAGTNKDGRLELFSIDSERKVCHTWQREPGGSWSAWGQLQFDHQQHLQFKDLVAAANQDGRLEVFGVSSNNDAVWRTRQREPNGGWREWQRLFHHTDRYMNLAVAPRPGLGLEVFGIARDGKMWHTWQKV